MRTFQTILIRISRSFDYLAGIMLAFTALLVVANIIGRTFLGSSIQGSFELVGLFTAAAVGLALARCALENSHIAVEFIMDRFSLPLRRAADIIVGLPSCLFLGFTTYNLFVYGGRIAASGEVLPTTRLAYYPFIYIVALGFFVLTLVVLLDLLKSVKGVELK